MNNETARVGAVLEPLDVLFFRDGRPLIPGLRGLSGLPLPQTTAGAIWAGILQAVGCDFDHMRALYQQETKHRCLTQYEYADVWQKCLREAGAPEWFFSMEIRGPLLVRGMPNKRARSQASDPGRWELLFPTPASLFAVKKAEDESAKLWLGTPLPKDQSLPGWKPPRNGMRPVWVRTREDVEPYGGFLSARGMQRFLTGNVPDPQDRINSAELFDHDDRTGLGINPDRLTAEEHQIYAVSHLALAKDVAFYVELNLPKVALPVWKAVAVLRWGGEGKQAAVRHLETPLRFPEATPQGDQKPLVVLTTPGLFKAGWYPECLANELVAAAVPGEVPVSGWDFARRGPKPTRFAAAAGAVYFLEQLPENLPNSLSDYPMDQRQGWGCFLQGVWSDG